MTGLRLQKGDAERGSVALEFVLIAPAMILLLGLVIVYGRAAEVSGRIEAAARDAARAASMESSKRSAQVSAESVAVDVLGEGFCRNSRLTELDDTFSAGLGVSVTVTCRFSVSDLALPGVPGVLERSAAFTSYIDPNRGLDES